jgi:hypothetical protein
MHTVELLEEALKTARKLGFVVRQDWLNGAGGACEVRGKRILFVDLSFSSVEQLDQVLAAIKQANPTLSEVPPVLHRHFERAKAA